MSNAERIFDQVIRDAHDLVTRRSKPRDMRERSLVELLDDLDDSKLPPIWKREPIARRRRTAR